MKDDISPTLIAKSDQLNAADLIGSPITVKVLGVTVSSTSDQPVSIKIDGDRQPYKPCKSMRRLLASLWGTSSKEWIGNSMTLYCDPDVLWAGVKAGGIRVSHATGVTSAKEVPLRASKHKVITYKIEPLSVNVSAGDMIQAIKAATNSNQLAAAIADVDHLSPADRDKVRNAYSEKVESIKAEKSQPAKMGDAE